MKPAMQVVDADDHLVGHVSRSDANYAEIIYRVSALWLTNSAGEVLIAQRKLTKDRDPGMWGPAVAGTNDEGETYESNIYKEAEEEIGLTGVKFQLGPKMHVTMPRHYFCQWFQAKVDQPADVFRLQEDEVEAVSWVAKQLLAEDVQLNPHKYVPHMPQILALFYGEQT